MHFCFWVNGFLCFEARLLVKKINLNLEITFFNLNFSDLRSRLNCQRQDWYFRSLCHRPSGKVQKTNKNCAQRIKSRMEWKILLVSWFLILKVSLIYKYAVKISTTVRIIRTIGIVAHKSSIQIPLYKKNFVYSPL